MNYKNLHLIFWFTFFSTFCFGSELVIEVTTDKYPNETSWKVFDTNKNLIHQNGTLLKNITYRDTLEVPADACYFWRIYDVYGNGMSNGTPPGDYKVYLDGALVASCENPNFGDSISVYGLGTGCVSSDVSLESLDFSSQQAFNPFDVTFSVLNFGSGNIESLLIGYDLGGWEQEPVLLEGLSIEFGEQVQLSFPEKLQFTTSGEVIFSLRVEKVNGTVDLNLNNNSLTKTILVADGYWQKPMHEEFTANWCGPCALANPKLKATLDQFPGQYSLIKYQYLNDSYFHVDGGRMATFYGVAGVPSMYINGNYFYPGDYTPEEFLTHKGQVTPVSLILNPMAIGDSVFVNVNIAATENFTSKAYLRLAVVENITTGNVGTNGEEEFENVFMKFLSNWGGDEIGQLTSGQSVTLTFKTKMSDTFVEEMNDLSVVGYLFYKNAYEVLQSEMVAVPYTPAAPVISFSIANGSVDIDTVLNLTIESDKPLIHSNGTEITDIQPVISFKENNGEGIDVAFTGSISNTKKTITITPVSNLKPNTEYFIQLSGVKSDEGIEVSDATLSFTTKNTVGITNIAQNNLQIFPNPANNLLTLNSLCSTEATILDAAGKTVMAKALEVGFNSWEISNLKAGGYFIKVTVENQSTFYKIIKY